MTPDPIHGPDRASGTSRRTFIRRAAIAAASVSAPSLLAACGTTSPQATGGGGEVAIGPGGLSLARPDRPVTLPIHAGNKSIASGLKPEAGPLQFYNWDQYINTDVVKAFEKKYGVNVQISTFTTIDEAIAKISSGAVQFDLFVPELVFLERLVVVVIVRGRLFSIGPEYEEAARDLGATPLQSLRLVLLPLLMPAILASMLIVFALSIDDFVVTQYMSSTSSTTTIPMYLYANARGGTTTPALNALATVLVLTTLLGIGIAYLLYTVLGRRASTGDVSVMRELSGLEAT